jgi:hypothetical protein
MIYFHNGDEYHIYINAATGELCWDTQIIGQIDNEYIDLIEDLLRDCTRQQNQLKKIRKMLR